MRKLIGHLLIFSSLFLYTDCQEKPEPPKKDYITIAAVGDIMMGTDYPTDKLPIRNGKFLLKDVESVLKSADFTFANLEAPLFTDGEPEKECADTNNCYIFRTPPSFIKNLTSAGIDIISLANNHAFDFGFEGYDATAKILNKFKIKHSGKNGAFAKWKFNDIKMGFIAFSPNRYCNNMLDSSFVFNNVKSLAEECDVVIVSFHGGAEGVEALHTPDSMETYFGELRGNVYQFARNAIDAGADLVLGHGPHVPRAIDIYKNRIIAYSLGNFCTYDGVSISDDKGLAPILKIKLSNTGKFLSGKIISAKQYRPVGTFLDDNQEAYNLIQKLTREDMGPNLFTFYSNGEFRKNELYSAAE